MKTSSEKTIIRIIKYAPILVILVFSVIGTYFLDYSSNLQYEKDFKEINEFYTKVNKDELVEEVYRVHQYIEEEQKNSINELKKSIKQRVYEAHAIATKIYEDNKDTKTKEEILELIKTALGSIIFNKGRGYFFIDNVDGVGILQPLNKQLENVNKLEFTDAKGYQFVKTIVQTIKDKSERYDTYYWYKGGDKVNSYKKMSFYKYFEPFNVAIGTGDYIDDFMRELKEKIIANIQKIKLKNEGYIFLFEESGKFLAHKNEELIGENISRHDHSFFKDFINIIESKNEGFVTYYNSTLFNQTAYKKTSYIKSYEKWNWIIGTGYSDEELDKIINKSQKELKEQKSKNFNTLLVVNSFITICLLIISTILSKKLERIFGEYKNIIVGEEKRFRNLFEHSNIGLVISNSKGEFIEVNNKFLDILRYKKLHNIKSKIWKDIIVDYDEEFENIFTAKKDYFSFEKRLKNSKNEMIEIFLTAKIFREKDDVKYILFSVIDISNVKKKDKILYQQSKMASMGEMLANIAHQWRQPLSVITAASTGAKFNIEANLVKTKDLIPTLENINESAIHLSQIIEDFRNFFNPKQNSIVEFDIDEVLDKTLNLVKAQFTAKDIKIIKNIDNIKINSLKNELIQAMINILNNSRDVLLNMDGERFIFIDVKKVRDELVIEIYDNAGGIKEDILNRVFEPYFTTKHQSVGTGIGLYMTQDIVLKLLKGSITVENKKFNYNSTEYLGASFIIKIPINS